MEEELNSPCTEEIAAFDQFIDYASQDKWQVIVFDTAPTGHTLRLLELPLDWSKQLDVKVFASADTVAADDVAKQRFGQVIDMMRDPNRSTFAFVMYPESTPIIEAYRASRELGTLDIPTGLVVANLVIPPEQATTPFSRARRTMQEKYLAEIWERFNVPVLHIPLLPHEVKGLDVLTELAGKIYQNGAAIPMNRRNQ
jgi:arsenite-transporting ATPase